MYFFNKLSVLLILLIFVMAGCRTNTSNKKANASFQLVTDSTLQGSSPYLTKDTKGIPVLSWVQENKEGQTQVYFARYVDSLDRFENPFPVPGSQGVSTHGENMPKIIFDKKGNALLVFAVKNPSPENPYTGAVYYTWSYDGGKNWIPAISLTDDTTVSYDQRYFDVALLQNGRMGLVWLNNSKPKGSTLYFSASNDSGYFSSRKELAGHTCQCCRTALLVDKKGTIHVAWRNIFSGNVRDMAYCCSKDDGKTFSNPIRISADDWKIDGCPHTGPAMAANKEGLHISWFTMGGGGGIFYCNSLDKEGFFSLRKVVSALPSARHPQMKTMDNGNIAIVWDEGIKNNNELHQRIGLQLRGPTGKVLDTRFLTAHSGSATFPQIELLNKGEAILVYTNRKGAYSQVRYKIVRL